MTPNQTSLEIIERLDARINYFANRTYVGSLCMDSDDLAQEAKLKIVKIVNDNFEKGFDALLGICITSIKNLFGVLIRKSKQDKYSGILIEMKDEVDYGSEDIQGLFIGYVINHLYFMSDETNMAIIDCLINPPEDLVIRSIEAAAEYGLDHEVKITRRVLANYLGISRSKLSREIEKMKEVVGELTATHRVLMGHKLFITLCLT